MNLYEIEKQRLFEEEIKVSNPKKDSSSDDDDTEDTESEYDFNDDESTDDKKEIDEVQVMDMFGKIEADIKSNKYVFDKYLVIQE